jgi:hypothetical protein
MAPSPYYGGYPYPPPQPYYPYPAPYPSYSYPPTYTPPPSSGLPVYNQPTQNAEATREQSTGTDSESDLWLPDRVSSRTAHGTFQPVQFTVEGQPTGSGISFRMGTTPAQNGPVLLPPLPQLPTPELPGYATQVPGTGFMANGYPPPMPNLPAPGYTMPAPMLPLPPGYLPPPPPAHPCFPSHAYARSPRDFFMWRENMEDRAQRRQPLPLP